MNAHTRRRFLQVAASGIAGAVWSKAAPESRFATRGVVLMPQDLSLADWPERAPADPYELRCAG